MAEMTLAKALKLKNRIARRVKQLTEDIRKYNSQPEGADQPDVVAMAEERVALTEQLIAVKTAISRANGPIQDRIYRLAELRGDIAFWRNLDTQHGRVVHPYSDASCDYVATIRKSDVDERVGALEKAQDDLQDEVDAFNHTTTITVDLG